MCKDALVERLRSGRWLGETTGAKAADRIEAQAAENAKLREALQEIASDDFGLQGLIEDGVYEETETSRYYAALVSWRRKRARAALETDNG